MVWPRMKGSTLGVMMLAFVVSSCEHIDSPTDPAARRAATVGDSEYTYLVGHAPGGSGQQPITVTKTLGSSGGQLHLAGHTLRVPAGAVLQPTVFSMTVPRDGYVEVDLQATLLNVLWRILLGLLDPVVGLLGVDFERPVTLELTYAWASNTPDDPRDIELLYLVDDRHYGPYEVVDSRVNQQRKVIIAKLHHFSRYCLAF